MTNTSSPDTTTRNPGPILWTGRVLSALPVLLLLFSAVMKLIGKADDGFKQLGYPAYSVVPIGVVELVCTILYLIPQTAVLGAILLTGYLGGATATHVRAGDGPAQFLMPVLLGVVLWFGLFLRDPRIRALTPWRRLPG